jgi:hypothetical protein
MKENVTRNITKNTKISKGRTLAHNPQGVAAAQAKLNHKKSHQKTKSAQNRKNNFQNFIKSKK